MGNRTSSIEIVEYDLLPVLQSVSTNWQAQLLDIANYFAKNVDLADDSVTRRESGPALSYSVVDGLHLHDEAPWMFDLYRTEFLRHVESFAPDQGVTSSVDLRTGVVMNVIDQNERYEVHIDSNPITAVLFVTSPLRRR